MLFLIWMVLLFDTEKMCYEITQSIADQLELPYTRERYLNYIGVSDKEIQASYYEIYENYDQEIVTNFIRYTHEQIHQQCERGDVPLKPGVLELLDYLKVKNIPMVIASSNLRPIIKLLIQKAGIDTYFSAIISAEDVQLAKPNPEIFQKAAGILKKPLENILIFEDSFNGISAAYQAGIPVIMIPDLIKPTAEIEKMTVAILDSLLQVPAYLTENLKTKNNKIEA